MWICFFPIFWHSTFADWFSFWKETRWIVANLMLHPPISQLFRVFIATSFEFAGFIAKSFEDAMSLVMSSFNTAQYIILITHFIKFLWVVSISALVPTICPLYFIYPLSLISIFSFTLCTKCLHPTSYIKIPSPPLSFPFFSSISSSHFFLFLFFLHSTQNSWINHLRFLVQCQLRKWIFSLLPCSFSLFLSLLLLSHSCLVVEFLILLSPLPSSLPPSPLHSLYPHCGKPSSHIIKYIIYNFLFFSLSILIKFSFLFSPALSVSPLPLFTYRL